MYYLYHIPGKKIGVTRNLNTRVTLMQGYKEDEYEVLDQSDDIDYISNREIELQQSYGYKVDRKLYKNLFKSNMKLNATEQTTTFPLPVNKLKGRLKDNVGLTWITPQGYCFEITSDNINWIMANVSESMYNKERCYIYNKAMSEAGPFEKHIDPNDIEIFNKIRQWANNRNLISEGDVKTQLVKLYEETGELSQSILKDNKDGIIDAIGDCVVVLTNLAELAGTRIEYCIDSAYSEISNRTGRMINGTFVKDA